uniref:Uncharacterized protein n=1 Tax=Rhizophora mucronata TaxID=61149 RepID=A0A2P2PF42_RHIMU
MQNHGGLPKQVYSKLGANKKDIITTFILPLQSKVKSTHNSHAM